MGVKSDERRMKNSSAAVDVRKLIRVLPFDRISFLKIICEKHPLPVNGENEEVPDSRELL